MTRGLRVVVPGDGLGSPVSDPQTMAEALADLLARVVASEPVTLVLLVDNGGGEIIVHPLPASLFVAKILVAEAYDQLHPERGADDD